MHSQQPVMTLCVDDSMYFTATENALDQLCRPKSRIKSFDVREEGYQSNGHREGMHIVRTLGKKRIIALKSFDSGRETSTVFLKRGRVTAIEYICVMPNDSMRWYRAHVIFFKRSGAVKEELFFDPPNQ
jgi:hypothetical protein